MIKDMGLVGSVKEIRAAVYGDREAPYVPLWIWANAVRRLRAAGFVLVKVGED